MTFAPRTWVVGEVVTAAELNAEIRDQFNTMFAAWTAYTPTWTASTTNPVINNGTLLGRYIKIGRTVHCHGEMIAGSTTTYGTGGWSFDLPFPAAAAVGNRVGHAHALGGTPRAAGNVIVAAGASTFSPFVPASTSVSFLSQATATIPFTWASTNQLRMSLTYEAST